MRTFLGVFMVLIVSGDDEMTITGVLEDSVLLPCTCPQRNLDKVFQWQMDKPSNMLLFKHNKTTSDFCDRYKGRAKIFLPENSSNCSILLTNITAGDQGKYRCSFHIQSRYQKFFVNLNISASYNICQENPVNNLNGGLSEKVYRCVAKGRYREAEIQWNLDGRLLENSTTTHITHTKTLDAPTGHHHFTSNLTTKLNWASRPTCAVKARGISTVISSDCWTVHEPVKDTIDPQTQDVRRYRYLNIIPIMLVLGLSLVLWRRWTSSEHRREVDGNGD